MKLFPFSLISLVPSLSISKFHSLICIKLLGKPAFQQTTTCATPSYKAPTLQPIVTGKGGSFAVDMPPLQMAATKNKINLRLEGNICRNNVWH